MLEQTIFYLEDSRQVGILVVALGRGLFVYLLSL